MSLKDRGAVTLESGYHFIFSRLVYGVEIFGSQL